MSERERESEPKTTSPRRESSLSSPKSLLASTLCPVSPWQRLVSHSWPSSRTWTYSEGVCKLHTCTEAPERPRAQKLYHLHHIPYNLLLLNEHIDQSSATILKMYCFFKNDWFKWLLIIGSKNNDFEDFYSGCGKLWLPFIFICHSND